MESGKEEDRIVCDPGVCGGKPRVRGTRVTVRDIVSMVAAGETIPTIRDEFPFLVPEDIRAAIDYASRCTEETVVALASG